jgi:membrane-associated protease RseP (regulator of RpoE activity)
LAAALSVAALGMASPSWARSDDEESGDKKDVRVYHMGDDDDDAVVEDHDGNTKVFRYKVESADAKGGYLGVRVQDITRELRQARDLTTDEGALVNRVEDESPADDAGIKRGDVIVEVNRKAIKDSEELIATMKGIAPGTKMDVVVLREGLRKTVKVEVAKRPHDVVMVSPNFRWKSNGSMDPEKMRSEMRMMMPGPELQEKMDQLRQEMDELKDQLRELREELRDSRDDSQGSRSGS